jgi:hypothetical protein
MAWLHRQKVPAVRAADLVQRCDVGMLERGCRASFLEEALASPAVADEIRRQHFECDPAAEALILCEVDLAHASGAEQGE